MISVSFLRYVVGSLAFGVLYDKLNKLLLLAVSTFGFALFNGAKPWCTLYPVMLVVNFLTGAFCGGLDTGGEFIQYSQLSISQTKISKISSYIKEYSLNTLPVFIYISIHLISNC